MHEPLPPSRIGEVIRPIRLAGILIGVVSGAGLALAYDAGRASALIVIVGAALLSVGIVLPFNYFASVVLQTFRPGFPLLGVRAAAAGVAGLTALVGLALARPTNPVVGSIGLAAGLMLVLADWGVRRRSGDDE